MKKLRLLISDRDRDYSQALGRAMSVSQLDFQVTVAGDAWIWEMFQSDLKEEGERNCDGVERADQGKLTEFDLILVDQEDWGFLRKKEGMQDLQVLGLCDESIAEEGLLYRYGGADAIAAQLRFEFGKVTGAASGAVYGSGVFPPIVSFYSGAGGCGQTTAMLGMAREFALHRDRRVLYLSLEEPDLTELYFGESDPGLGAGEFIYYLLRSDQTGIAEIPQIFLKNDDCGVEAFPTTPGRNEFRSLNEEELERLLLSVCGGKQYDYLLCDLPSELLESVEYILKHSAVIVMVQRGDPVSNGKNEKAKSLWRKTWQSKEEEQSDSVDERMEEDQRILELFCGGEDQAPHGKFRIPWERECVAPRDGKLRIDIHQALGKGVSQLADEIQRRCELDG